MRSLCHKAREIPALQNTFRRLYLNQWTEQSERWIDMAAWDACGGPADWRRLREAKRGAACIGALDLSSRTDLTALALFFDDNSVVPWFWVPAEGAAKRSRTDRVPYEQWIREGLLTATPGNVVDQGFIREDINRLAKDYRLKELAFDPWNASKLSLELQGDGIAVVEMRQGFRSAVRGDEAPRGARGGPDAGAWRASGAAVDGVQHGRAARSERQPRAGQVRR